MGRKKQVMVLPHLVDAGGDMKKEWFVEYSMRDPYTGEMKRFREYAGFNKLKTAEERYALGERMVAAIKEKIAAGWNPYTAKATTYEDNIMMSSVASRWGNVREGVVNIRTHLSEFLGMKKAEVSHKSYQTYQSKIRIFCEWAEQNGLDKIHVGHITNEHIQDFMRSIAEGKGLSRLTMEKYGQILHSFFDWMIRVKKLLKENPVTDLPRIGKVVDRVPKPIPDQERARLLAAMRKYDRQLWIVCQLEYYCAIRPGECRLLKVGDVDLDNAVIRVPADVAKNRQAETVAMPVQLVNVFRKESLCEADRGYYLFSASGLPGEKMLGKNSFRNRFNALRDKLHLPPEYKLYSFKYTGGVKLVNAGIDTWELQRHMRHKSIDTTEHYIRKNFAVKSDTIKNHFPDIE